MNLLETLDDRNDLDVEDYKGEHPVTTKSYLPEMGEGAESIAEQLGIDQVVDDLTVEDAAVRDPVVEVEPISVPG